MKMQKVTHVNKAIKAESLLNLRYLTVCSHVTTLRAFVEKTYQPKCSFLGHYTIYQPKCFFLRHYAKLYLFHLIFYLTFTSS